MISRRNSALALASIAAAATIFVAPVHAQNAPRVKLATSLGDIVVELNPAKAPKTVENFLKYVADKHYDGTIFHRVIDGFMIQGGGFTPDMVQKPMRPPIPLEATNGLKNDTYTIAMARTNVPDSATAQFFINVKDNAMLNAPQPDGHGYAVFGKVVSGTEVVDKIKGVPTGNKGPFQNVPTTPVVITSATLVK
ncbi:MAG TPA: peptidylprolyl isomerase [Giesbergeria sp.]|jgi:peptidyl-prolyl cis-trans isomerase A (cyclophilin A)|uniref:peptidylprolyl isomerase n=1 Tax=Comamonadaceae TaxID=80864 RepID=UPI00138A2F49|nr:MULTISPECIES: peptidylprolyl isomerase [unclassified Acidovorax]HMZ86728.1 peptidylprolyl isomerase [Giesbergeria sp.]NCU65093.1 peptidyl-prolyl cis-trans isomerase [Acidovorax sp. 210-6]HNE72674.1 peptidylprolyl isomerase [Giesbergeria sp.]HNI76943.1 peptidylprolyl isomerase [Giesbergeria sp.]HNK06439.1 peptidylprolyl isomerase [Giesbergeria sp.]